MIANLAALAENFQYHPYPAIRVAKLWQLAFSSSVSGSTDVM